MRHADGATVLSIAPGHVHRLPRTYARRDLTPTRSDSSSDRVFLNVQSSFGQTKHFKALSSSSSALNCRNGESPRNSRSKLRPMLYAKSRGARRALARGASAETRRSEEAGSLLRRRHLLLDAPRVSVDPEEEIAQADGRSRTDVPPRRIQDLEVLPLRAGRAERRLVARRSTRVRARPRPQDMRGHLCRSVAMPGSRRTCGAEHAAGGCRRRTASQLAGALTTITATLRTSSTL